MEKNQQGVGILEVSGYTGVPRGLAPGEQPLLTSAHSLGSSHLAVFSSHPRGAYLHPYELSSKEQWAILSHAVEQSNHTAYIRHF